MLQMICFCDKLGGRRGIELEHLIVARDDALYAGIVRELRGFMPVEIARDAPLGVGTIDGQESEIGMKRGNALGHAGIKNCVAAMIDDFARGTNDVAEKLRLNRLVSGGYGDELEAVDGRTFAFAKADRPGRVCFKAVGDECSIYLGNDQPKMRIDGAQCEQRFSVEMIGVVVTRRNDIDEIEFFRSDHTRSHADVGFVAGGIFLGE